MVGGFSPYPPEKWSESQLGWIDIPNMMGKSVKIPWFQSPPTSKPWSLLTITNHY